MYIFTLFRAGCLAILAASVFALPIEANTRVLEARYEIVAIHPHSPRAFTQGLLLNSQGQIIESSGNYGASYLARYSLHKPLQPLARYAFANRYFAEGAALLTNKLFVLTWKSGLCFVLKPDDFSKLGTLRYSGQGWGLTSDGKHLIMSDGSATLTVRSPEDFSIQREISVTLNGRPVQRLNELEWARDRIYANIWYSDAIIGIEPNTGQVVERVDLSALRRMQGSRADALNGIAYDINRDLFYVTGKYWRHLYAVKFLEPEQQTLKSHQQPINEL